MKVERTKEMYFRRLEMMNVDVGLKEGRMLELVFNRRQEYKEQARRQKT